jgi:hypothetical protein
MKNGPESLVEELPVRLKKVAGTGVPKFLTTPLFHILVLHVINWAASEPLRRREEPATAWVSLKQRYATEL